MNMKIEIQNLEERFCRYVKIDTQSDPLSDSVPSTGKQKDLANVLVNELHALGIEDAYMDSFGYVYATVQSNTDKSNVPTICFCSHMDTSPDASGKNVKPLFHRSYSGNDIILPDDPEQIIRPSDYPYLSKKIGDDIITASGTTLLGADNKSGIAAIMTAVETLQKNKDLKHGAIRILFTPDEEIGRGVDQVDMKKLGAEFGYTIDGADLGSMENETFSADGVVLTIKGVSAHPGYAKGKMENSLRIAGKILAALPLDEKSPESTSGKEGFIHPTRVQGILEEVVINFIIRDFEVNGLLEKAATLKGIVEDVMKEFPNSTYNFEVIEQYRNMKSVLDEHPQVVEFALEAIKKAGIEPTLSSIRGGTDGSRLSFIGMPCPNIFAGEQAFHSKHEWVSVQDMVKSAETIVHLCSIWESSAT